MPGTVFANSSPMNVLYCLTRVAPQRGGRDDISSRGSVMMESLFSYLIMSFLIIGTFDLGSLCLAHMSSSRIAYEGVRYAASLSGLPDTTNVVSCERRATAEATACHPVLALALDRMDRLALAYGYTSANRVVRVELQPRGSDQLGGRTLSVKVNISIPLVTPFLSFFPLNVGALSTAPYLVRDQQEPLA